MRLNTLASSGQISFTAIQAAALDSSTLALLPRDWSLEMMEDGDVHLMSHRDRHVLILALMQGNDGEVAIDSAEADLPANMEEFLCDRLIEISRFGDRLLSMVDPEAEEADDRPSADTLAERRAGILEAVTTAMEDGKSLMRTVLEAVPNPDHIVRNMVVRIRFLPSSMTFLVTTIDRKKRQFYGVANDNSSGHWYDLADISEIVR